MTLKIISQKKMIKQKKVALSVKNAIKLKKNDLNLCQQSKNWLGFEAVFTKYGVISNRVC